MYDQGHNYHKLLFSTVQKYYILDDGGNVSVLLKEYQDYLK